MDLDGDGIQDILSGSWPGEIFLFRGLGKGQFAPPEMLKDADGNVINCEGGIREQPDGSVLIFGTVSYEDTPQGRVVVYQGRRFPAYGEKPVAVSGTASSVHATDWDGDGDLDLLVGTISGRVYVVINKGSRQKYAFTKEVPIEAGERPITVPHGDAGPFVADWDQDGKADLLVGAGDGSVWFYRNTSQGSIPVLEAGTALLPASLLNNRQSGYPSEPVRGLRAKICVTDWNEDGLVDLLVGDFAMQRPQEQPTTPDEQARRVKVRQELAELQKQYGELSQKLYGPQRIKDSQERSQLVQQQQEVLQQLIKLQEQLPREYEYHGWVWLFLRKSASHSPQK